MHNELAALTMPEREQADLAAETFRMLADPTRIKILWALLQGESSVNCLAELAGPDGGDTVFDGPRFGEELALPGVGVPILQ